MKTLDEIRVGLNDTRTNNKIPPLGTADDTAAINEIIKGSQYNILWDRTYTCEDEVRVISKLGFGIYGADGGGLLRTKDEADGEMPWNARTSEHLSIEGGANITVKGLKVRGVNKGGGRSRDRTPEEARALAEELGSTYSRIPKRDIYEGQAGIGVHSVDGFTLCENDIADVYGDNIGINSLGSGVNAKNSKNGLVYANKIGPAGRMGMLAHGVEGLSWFGGEVTGWHSDIFHVEMQGTGDGRLFNSNHKISDIMVDHSTGYFVHITGEHDYDGLVVERIMRTGGSVTIYVTGRKNADGTFQYRNFRVSSTHWDTPINGGYQYRFLNVGGVALDDNEGPLRDATTVATQCNFQGSTPVVLGHNRLTRKGQPVIIPTP